MKTDAFIAAYRPIARVDFWGDFKGIFATFNHCPEWGMPGDEVVPGIVPCEPAMQVVRLSVPLNGPCLIDDPDTLKSAFEALPYVSRNAIFGRGFDLKRGAKPSLRILRRIVWSWMDGTRSQRKSMANTLIKGGEVAVAKFLGGVVDKSIDRNPSVVSRGPA